MNIKYIIPVTLITGTLGKIPNVDAQTRTTTKPKVNSAAPIGTVTKNTLAPNLRVTQINFLKEAVSNRIEIEISKWAQRDAPSTSRGLNLYKLAMLEVIDDLLQQGLQKPLTNDELSSFKSGLVSTAISPFLLGGPEQEIDNNTLETVENHMSNVVSLWDIEGKTLTKELWKLSFQSRLDVALNHRLDTNQKKQVSTQIDKLANLVEKEVKELFPSASQEEILSLSGECKKRSIGELENELSPEFKVVILDQDWPSFVHQGMEATRERIKTISARKEQFPQDLESKVEDAYTTLFSALGFGMTYNSPKQANNYPKDFGENWQKYQAKIAQDNSLDRIHLANSIAARQVFQDRENIAALIELGIGISQ